MIDVDLRIIILILLITPNDYQIIQLCYVTVILVRKNSGDGGIYLHPINRKYTVYNKFNTTYQ